MVGDGKGGGLERDFHVRLMSDMSRHKRKRNQKQQDMEMGGSRVETPSNAA